MSPPSPPSLSSLSPSLSSSSSSWSSSSSSSSSLTGFVTNAMNRKISRRSKYRINVLYVLQCSTHSNTRS
ncbi:MAG: hypothetical protein EBU66_17935 [Bacteroidetes bacterium]|nr:hypothetical protein [Bacteroidota bacterium]